MNYFALTPVPQGPGPFSLIRWLRVATSHQGEKRQRVLRKVDFHCDFSSVAVTWEPILALVMGTKRPKTHIWISFASFIADKGDSRDAQTPAVYRIYTILLQYFPNIWF